MRKMRPAALAALLGAFLATGAQAAQRPPNAPGAPKPFFDSRTSAREAAAQAGNTVAAARPSSRTVDARSAFRATMGDEGVLDVDPLTGTPRQLLRTDGALSSSRGASRTDIARAFVTDQRAVLGLSESDLATLDGGRVVPGARGLTVVHFRQLYRGIPAFDNDLRVGIDRAGRVLSVAGSPRSGLSVGSIDPTLSGAQALAALQRNVGVVRAMPVTDGPSGVRQTTTFAGGDFARLVLFGAANEALLAWHVTYRATSDTLYDAVVDAQTGAILYRQNLTRATVPRRCTSAIPVAPAARFPAPRRSRSTSTTTA